MIIAVLSNLNSRAPVTIGLFLGDLVEGKPVTLPSERKAVAVSPEILRQYAGTYELHPGFNIVVTLEENQLMEQATGQKKFPLFAESENKFFLKVVDAQLEFVRDRKGTVSSLILHQGGRDQPAIRK